MSKILIICISKRGNMIEVKNLYLKFIREYYALYNINLKVEDGECVAFIGKEHSGRTTLLRTIAGLERFDSGEVFIDDRDLKTINFKTDTSLGYIPEVPVFFENKTVYQNLRYVLQERKLSKNEIEEKINTALINFNIEKYKNIKIKDLDLYEKYLISFVRLSLRKLNYLLIDNIFNKLTEEDGDALLQLVQDIFKINGTTIIVVTDNYKKVEKFCNRGIYFESGSIVEN